MDISKISVDVHPIALDQNMIHPRVAAGYDVTVVDCRHAEDTMVTMC